MKDPAGTIHSYSYDQHGRLLHDRVTALPAALDGTVRRISRSYDTAGRWTRISSWDRDYLTAPAGQPAPVAVNEVKLETNAWGQLIADRQAHSGLVDAASPAVPVGSVQYGYANGAANHLRRTSLTMPSGRQVLTDYDAGFDDRLSRFTRLRLADGAGYTSVLTQTYAGAGRVVRMDYPQPQLQWTLLAQAGENTLSNKAPYTGLDRFGRMIQARWLTASATGTPQTRVHVRYWYDRGSRRIWRDTPNAPAGSKEAEGYTYDGLSQVTGRQRGQLQFDPQGAITGIVAPPEREEAFRYDTLGNWQRYTVKEPDLTNPPAQISVLDQTRSHNPSNQITGFSNSTEPVTHDPAGNTTRTAPSPSGDWSKSVKYVWDAWNRLIAVLDASSSDAEIARHAYDGITRRTWLREGGPSGTVRHFFYNDQWRSVEERIGTSGNAERQHVFHPANRWHLILRDRNADGVGTSLEERLYSLHDAMDPVAITDATGAVVERYSYSAFGQRRVMDGVFVDKVGGTSRAWNWEFHGEFLDLASRKHLYGYRYFSVISGRWIARDPLPFPQSSQYAFISNRPLSSIDILGLADDTSAYELGWEWLTGTSNPVRNFVNGDLITEEMKTTPEADDAREKIKGMLTKKCAAGQTAKFRRDLFKSGYWENVDYGLDFAGDLAGRNPSRAFMGSFNGTATVTKVDCIKCCAQIHFHLFNRAGWESATRLPRYGYRHLSDGTPRPALLDDPLYFIGGLFSSVTGISDRPASDFIPKSIVSNNSLGDAGRTITVNVDWDEELCWTPPHVNYLGGGFVAPSPQIRF